MIFRRSLVVTALAAAATAVSSAPAVAAVGGLSVTPAFLEGPAQPGPVGTFRLENGSAEPIAVTVRTREWVQSGTGAVRAHARRALPGVRLAAGSFQLSPGQSRTVSVSLARRPRSGSVYGALEVIGVPQGARRPGAVLTRYRLLSGLRLNPTAGAERLRTRVGPARQRGRLTTLRVSNRGNTIRPVTGSARITGPTGTLRGSIDEQRILPGRTVDVRLRSGRLPAGSYSARVTLEQGGRRVAVVTRRFLVR